MGRINTNNSPPLISLQSSENVNYNNTEQWTELWVFQGDLN